MYNVYVLDERKEEIESGEGGRFVPLVCLFFKNVLAVRGKVSAGHCVC